MVLSENALYLEHQKKQGWKGKHKPLPKERYIKLNSLRSLVYRAVVSNCFHEIQVQKRQFNISKRPYKYLNNTGYSNAYTLNLKQIAVNQCINLFLLTLNQNFFRHFVPEILRDVSLIIKPVFL